MEYEILFFCNVMGVAIVVMTILSAAMGFALPNLMPKKYTHYGAAVLFW